MTENEKNYDILIRFIIKGDYNVGKTSILNRYVQDKFYQNFITTIGIDFQAKTIEQYDRKIKLQIWDQVGAERYRKFASYEIRNTKGIIFTYDITSRYSFEVVKQYMDAYIQLRQKENIVQVLIGNKCDLEMDRQVSYNEGQQLANSFGILFFETSAKDSVNVNTCFEELTNQILQVQ